MATGLLIYLYLLSRIHWDPFLVFEKILSQKAQYCQNTILSYHIQADDSARLKLRYLIMLLCWTCYCNIAKCYAIQSICRLSADSMYRVSPNNTSLPPGFHRCMYELLDQVGFGEFLFRSERVVTGEKIIASLPVLFFHTTSRQCSPLSHRTPVFYLLKWLFDFALKSCIPLQMCWNENVLHIFQGILLQ